MYIGNEPIGPCTGLKINEVFESDVSSSGAVSPITRAVPKIAAVIRPLRTVGNTIIMVVRHWRAPRAKLAERKSSGTSFNTSSDVRATVGSIKIPRANEPASALNEFVALTYVV